MKIRPVGAKLFHAEGLIEVQTHMTQLTVAFRSISNSPKILFLPHIELADRVMLR